MGAMSKITAAEFFDSITSIEKPKDETGGPIKRRIIPYCDNSLSSGTSAFASQDVSFDSKDSSSPSDTDRTPQMLRAAPDLTLAIHPMRSPPVPQNIPVPPLSRRSQPDQGGPGPPGSQPHQQPELYVNKQAERNANTVRSDVDDEANEAKDTTTVTTTTTTTNNIQPPLTPKIQPIRSATERLKWKFLGW